MSVWKRDRESTREWGRRKRESAEFDQYSNCKMNLTGARTSHQMGKEIGYERWPAIKSDIPQCHLSDSGRGIMTTANESWAPVRRWFKSAPRSGRLAVLTQCPVLRPTQLDATEQKSKKTCRRDPLVCDIPQVLKEVSDFNRDIKGQDSYRTALVELMELKDASAVWNLVVMEASS